jgi:EmrB/QacA subfamily drug resistance transporter
MSDTQEVTNIQEKQSIKNRSWLLFAVCIVAFMVEIDYTAVNVALESMAKTVHSDLTTIQWVLSGYVLAWGAMVISGGRLADLYGKRRMFIIGVSIFVLGSVLTGLSTTAWTIIFSRVLQGLGGALFLPAIYTLVFTAYPNDERGKAMGILTSAFAVGMAVGPTLGGVILHLLDWRYIFFVNLPLGIIVIALTLWAIPKEMKKLLDESMDYVGSILLAATFVMFMIGVNQVKNSGITNPITLTIFLGFFLLLAVTLFTQGKTKYPILKLSLFKNKAFLGCILSYIFLGYNFSTLLIIGGLYLQNVMEYSALQTGVIFLSMTVGFGILSTYAGRLCDRFDMRLILTIGGISLMVGTLIFANLTPYSSLWSICTMFFLAGVGLGFAFPALNLAMMSVVADEELNVASGTFTLFGCLGNTIGLIMSAVSIVYFGQAKLFDLFKQSKISLDGAQEQALNTLMASAHYAESTLSVFGKQSLPIVMENLHEAFVFAMSRSLMIALVFAFLSIMIGVALVKVPGRR